MSDPTGAVIYSEGQDCPARCGEPIIHCDCGDSGPDGHLICLGCGEDAGGCDCRADPREGETSRSDTPKEQP